MKLRIFILTTLFTFFAHAEPAPAVDLNKVCRQTEEGKANLDGATFHLQCRSLERNNFYIATLRADGSSKSSLGPRTLQSVLVVGKSCFYTAFDNLERTMDGYKATQTSEDGSLFGEYYVRLNGRHSRISVEAKGLTSTEKLDCY